MPQTKEKKERSLGVHLHLKGERCASPKCALVRKPYPPGVHGKRRVRKNVSEYGLQIKEKQKFKLTYGVNERNLRNIFERAAKASGSSAAKVLELLERRAANVVFRLGLAPSHAAAHQLILHGHIAINSKKVTSPGYIVKEGDVISVKSGSENNSSISKRREAIKQYEPPEWLHLDREKLEGRVIALPKNVESPFEVKLLVEAFSK